MAQDTKYNIEKTVQGCITHLKNQLNYIHNHKHKNKSLFTHNALGGNMTNKSPITAQAFTFQMNVQNEMSALIDFITMGLHHTLPPHSRRWIHFLNRFGHDSPLSLTNCLLECIREFEYYCNDESQCFNGWESHEHFGSSAQVHLRLPEWYGNEEVQISMIDALALCVHYFFCLWPQQAAQFLSTRPQFEKALMAWYENASADVHKWMN